MSYDVDDMNDISKALKKGISEVSYISYSFDYMITASDVVAAIGNLKCRLIRTTAVLFLAI